LRGGRRWEREERRGEGRKGGRGEVMGERRGGIGEERREEEEGVLVRHCAARRAGRWRKSFDYTLRHMTL
jgi:hypothetical protein